MQQARHTEEYHKMPYIHLSFVMGLSLFVCFYPAGAAAGSCFLLVSSFFLHSRSRRLCFVSVRFLSSVNISKSYISDMTRPILTRLGHKYRLTIPFMSYDQIGVKGHVGVTGVKKVIFTKKSFKSNRLRSVIT